MDDRILQIILRARDEASKLIADSTASITRNFEKAEDASKKFAAGLLGVGAAATGIIGYGAKIAGDLESSRQGFITLLGSADKADAAIAQIKKDAAATPFELPGLISANQMLTTVTKDAGKSETLLMNVGKALSAMGKGQPELDRIIANLQQIGATGKITEMDVRQFGNAGIDVLGLLADYYGTTKDKASDMLKSSTTGFADLEGAFAKAGGAGGKFADAFKNQQGTFNQLVSNMKDSFGIFISDLVNKSGAFEGIKRGVKGLIDFMNNHGKDVGATIVRFLDFVKQNGPVVAGIILGGLTPAIVGMAWAFGLAALALAPYILAGAALGLLAKVIIDNWGPISGFFTNLWGTVSGAFQAAMGWIAEKATWLKDHWAEALGFVIGFVATLPIKLPMLLGQAIDWMIARVMQVNWGAVFNGILTGASAIFKGVMDAALAAWNYLKGLDWGAILTSIGKGIANAVIGLIEGGINGALSAIPGGKKVSLPRFASGTDYAPGGLAIVGERGPELVNLPRGSQVIPNNQSQGLMGGQTIHIAQVVIRQDSDIETLARRLEFHRRTGGRA